MILGFTQPLESDCQTYLTVLPSQAMTVRDVNQRLWTVGDGSGLFDAGWKARAAGHQTIGVHVAPLIGFAYGPPRDAYSGAGAVTSHLDPTGAANPTVMTLVDVAAGVWDLLFTQAFINIAADFPDAILRIGGEEYGPGWYEYCGVALGAEMSAAYQHLVPVARAVSPTFQFEWNGALPLPLVHGYTEADIVNFYPGDDVVDYITIDTYDTFDGGGGTTSWNSRQAGFDFGLPFAASHGKPYCITEWGLQNVAQTGVGHDDDPEYIQAAYDWGREHQDQLGWMCYYNNPPGVYGGSWDGCLQQNPQSAAVFKATFGAWARELAGLPGRFRTPGYGQIGAIAQVGTFARGSSVGLRTLAVNPAAVGNALVLSIIIPGHLATTPVSAVSGGGATWTKIVNANPSSLAGDAELWLGVVTTTGAATITITTAAVGTVTLGCDEFSLGTPATWAVESSAATSTTAAAATGNYPSVTPAGLNRLYVGTANLAGGTVGGASTGFIYHSGGLNYASGSQYVYKASATSGVAHSPPWSQTSHAYAAVAAIITATPVTPGGGSHRQRMLTA